ncbi:hypothetical protein H6P81_007861 [Aristolochia fimbriata]|uniref:Uncharacterized protein n=1 Tax=Aristolochia fimbriata TaxID=158543 RepID=A0AAV7F1K1_ARIFI|nr:hypothetical protein H6P81_007861 [Aristolochia fimbriata]
MAADGGSRGNGGGALSVKVPTTPSPKGSPKSGRAGDGSGAATHCLCSPTTHPGSFRCRFHRAMSTSWMRRSKSMPASKPAVVADAGVAQEPA